ncbi:PIN domain-containing protein [bacterium]|nr:PIN domain-containing protein [bacterium]
MRLYLDMCSIQRPLDDRSQARIAVEAEAVLAILSACERGAAELLASRSLFFEMERNPHPLRRDFAAQVLARATVVVEVSPAVELRTRALCTAGLKPLDAAHLASAIEGRADFFCTCDDRLLRRARALATLGTRAVTPEQLIVELLT